MLSYFHFIGTYRLEVKSYQLSPSTLGKKAFWGCRKLVRVTAPFVEEVGERAFKCVYNLRYVNVSPDTVAKPRAFVFRLTLQVLAVSVGFELDTGDRWGSGN